MATPVAPAPPGMEREQASAERVLQVASWAHVPVPSAFTSGGCCTCIRTQLSGQPIAVPGCCVDLLTAMNYLWTTEVQVLSYEEHPLVISYGRGDDGGVTYPAIRREGPSSVTFVSKLSETLEHHHVDAGTTFTLDADGALRMTYLRFGARAEFILAGEGSVDLTRAKEISACSCCARGCVAASQACVDPCARLVRRADLFDKTQTV